MQKHNNHAAGGVGVVFDALHGDINLSDFCEGCAGQLEKLASSPFLKRLQRIKQLGFVSQNFLSAQHNRYAHALGTAHIMRRLIAHVENRDSLFERALLSVHQMTGDVRFSTAPDRKALDVIAYLKQHLVVAAIIQDVGELPYETASATTFCPGEAIRSVLHNANIDLNQTRNKDIFTLYFVWEDTYGKEYFDGLNKALLTFLISGHVPKGKAISPEMLALRQMLDGKSIDADRIDYVYRDAFHTIGVHHSPDALIESIFTFDKDGTILTRVRPVTDFIVTRAMLWSNVYLSPENRFRVILLKTALNELSKKPDVFEKYFEFKHGEIKPEDFLALDDNLIDSVIRQVHEDKPDVDRTSFKLLEEGAPHYDYRWVAFSENSSEEWKGELGLPNGFYWDTYADYRERNHSLYDKGSIRVRGSRYALLGPEVELENCVGPFCKVLQDGTWPAFPMPNHMAWFAPHSVWDSADEMWKDLRNFRGAAQLTSQLKFRDPIKGATFVADTRNVPGFKPPSIFLAFAWEDKEFVERLARILHDMKRQYWTLTDGGKGFGASPAKNSSDAVGEAGAVILLASKAYLKTYASDTDGGIHAEVTQMEVRKDEIPIIPVGLDTYAELSAIKPFPWRPISADGQQNYLGDGMRRISSDEFRTRVIEVLKKIDEFNVRPR